MLKVMPFTRDCTTDFIAKSLIHPELTMTYKVSIKPTSPTTLAISSFFNTGQLALLDLIYCEKEMNKNVV